MPRIVVAVVVASALVGRTFLTSAASPAQEPAVVTGSGFSVATERVNLLASADRRELSLRLKKGPVVLPSKTDNVETGSAAPLKAGQYHPVILVAPLLGSNLEATNSKEKSKCNTKGSFDLVWIDPEQFGLSAEDIPRLLASPLHFILHHLSTTAGLPDAAIKVLECIIEDLEVGGWDAERNLSLPKDGITIRPEGGYKSDMMEALNIGGNFVGLWKTQVLSRLHELGFVDGVSVFGHSYDWRLGVNDWQAISFKFLKQSTEEAVENAEGKRAILTSLSMGGTYIHSFLSFMKNEDPDWAGKYVEAFAPIAAPFNGATMALETLLDSPVRTFIHDGESICPDCTTAEKLQNGANFPESGNKRLLNEFMGKRRLSVVGGAIEQSVLDEADKYMRKLSTSWPSIYWMSPAVDYSTTPPTDRVVVTLHKEHPECLESSSSPESHRSGASCGARGLNDDVVLFANETFLPYNQCATCYKELKLWGGCEEGYEATRADLLTYCCKKLECTPTEYRASELPQLFRDLGRPDSQVQMMEYALTQSTTMDPGVPVHCIIAHNVKSYKSLEFPNTDARRAVVIKGDGDGTVESDSLEVCSRWPSTRKVYKIPGVSHGSMLDVAQVVDVLQALALDDEQAWQDWKEPAMSDVITTKPSSKVAASALFNEMEQ